MTVRRSPALAGLQNAEAGQPGSLAAETHRLGMSGLLSPADGLHARYGIFAAPAGWRGEVTWSPGPGTLTVAPFRANVAGTQADAQGDYTLVNDAPVVVDAPGPHPTYGRIALLATYVRDTDYLPNEGEDDVVGPALILGDPDPAPEAPDLPPNALLHGTLTVPASGHGPATWAPEEHPTVVTLGGIRPVTGDQLDEPGTYHGEPRYSTTGLEFWNDDLDAWELVKAAYGGPAMIPVTQKGAPGGVATLDTGGKVPAAQLPTLGDVTASWIARTPAVIGNNWSSVAWSPSLRLFVAVASAGNTNVVMTSPDGVTWTQRTVPVTNSLWSAVTWSAERALFVAVATNAATNNIMTSPDGITWTQRTQPNAYPINDVCWASDLGLFVAVVNNGSSTVALGRAITSPDGITWTARSLGGTTAGGPQSAQTVSYSPQLNRLVAAFDSGASNSQFWYSADGITWTAAGNVTTTRTWRRIAWSPERALFVAVATDAGGIVATSPDGITWTDRGPVAGTTSGVQLVGVTWAREVGLFAAVASTSGGTGPWLPRIWVSPDGVTWSSRPDPRASVWRSVVWSRELARFVVVGDAGALATSFC